MKIVCEKKDLVSAMSIAMRAVPSKVTMPILECIVLDAREKIILTSNDMEFGVKTVMEGTVIEEGTIAIDAKLFNDIARKLPDRTDVEIEADETLTISVKCGKARFKLPGKSADDFPFLKKVDSNITIDVNQAILKDMISKTMFCVASADTNRMMTGMYIEVDGGTLRTVGLDGHRIAIRTANLSEEYRKHSAIVPGRTLAELSKILSSGNISVGFGRMDVVFTFDDTIVASRTIEGEYFKYEQIASAKGNSTTKIIADGAELSSSIGRATTLMKESEKKPLVFDIKDDYVHVSAVSNLGMVEEDLPVEKSGADIRIGFNPRFLLEAVNAADDDNVEISFINAKSPVFVSGETDDYLYVVLPVNLG